MHIQSSKKLKCRVGKKSINLEWNEELILYIEDPVVPIRLTCEWYQFYSVKQYFCAWYPVFTYLLPVFPGQSSVPIFVIGLQPLLVLGFISTYSSANKYFRCWCTTGPGTQHTSLAIYILMRAAVLASRCGIKSKCFGKIYKPLTWSHGDVFLTCLSSAQILLPLRV